MDDGLRFCFIVARFDIIPDLSTLHHRRLGPDRTGPDRSDSVGRWSLLDASSWRIQLVCVMFAAGRMSICQAIEVPHELCRQNHQ